MDTRGGCDLGQLSVAHAANEERHGRAEHGGEKRRGDSCGTGRRARRGLVGGQSDPSEGRRGDGRDDDGAEDLGGHDPSCEKENVADAAVLVSGYSCSSKNCGGGE